MLMNNSVVLSRKHFSRRAMLAAAWLLAAFSIIWLATPAQAGAGYAMHPVQQIRNDINHASWLDYNQKANWRSVMLPAARRGLQNGLPAHLVTELARVGLRRGATPWTYSEIIDRLIRVRLAGGNPVPVARRLAIRHYYGANNYADSTPWHSPGVRPSNLVRVSDLRSNLATWHGTPYRVRSAGRHGVDAGSFTRAFYASYGISLPHSRYSQAQAGAHVDRWNLRLGDMVVLRTHRGGLVALGVYQAGGLFLHADRAQGSVVVSRLDSRRFRGLVVEGRRMLNLAPAYGRHAWLVR